jgi:hypothetical protein
MSVWWEALTLFEKVLWAIALFFSLLFILQTVLAMIGADSDGSMGDADASVHADHGEGNSYFTIRNLVTFFTMFAWTGLACQQNGLGELGSMAIGTVVGLLMVALMVWLMNKAASMKHSGTLETQRTVGLTGTTYLLIPAARSGMGKISVRVQGNLRDLDAMTDDPSPIATGTMVTVTSVINDRILLVSRTL